jgi:hypothetical protein
LAQQRVKAQVRNPGSASHRLCPPRSPESQCLLLETLDGSTIYSFIAAPKPELNRDHHPRQIAPGPQRLQTGHSD